MDAKTVLICGSLGIDLAIRFGGAFVGGITGYRLTEYKQLQTWDNMLHIFGFGCVGFVKPTTTLVTSMIAIAAVNNINYHSNKNN